MKWPDKIVADSLVHIIAYISLGVATALLAKWLIRIGYPEFIILETLIMIRIFDYIADNRNKPPHEK